MQGDIDDIKKLIEQQEIARDQDPGTGETHQEQHLSEIKAMESDLKRITKKGGNTKQLQIALNKKKKNYQKKYKQIFE